MILNRQLYAKITLFKSLWHKRQIKKFFGEKVYKDFGLHKTIFPEKLYFYSPRLRKVPRFTGNVKLLSSWKDAKTWERLCPTLAITVTEKSFEIDPKGCIACGLCVDAAPEGLLEISPYDQEPKIS